MALKHEGQIWLHCVFGSFSIFETYVVTRLTETFPVLFCADHLTEDVAATVLILRILPQLGVLTEVKVAARSRTERRESHGVQSL